MALSRAAQWWIAGGIGAVGYLTLRGIRAQRRGLGGLGGLGALGAATPPPAKTVHGVVQGAAANSANASQYGNDPNTRLPANFDPNDPCALFGGQRIVNPILGVVSESLSIVPNAPNLLKNAIAAAQKTGTVGALTSGANPVCVVPTDVPRAGVAGAASAKWGDLTNTDALARELARQLDGTLVNEGSNDVAYGKRLRARFLKTERLPDNLNSGNLLIASICDVRARIVISGDWGTVAGTSVVGQCLIEHFPNAADAGKWAAGQPRISNCTNIGNWTITCPRPLTPSVMLRVQSVGYQIITSKKLA